MSGQGRRELSAVLLAAVVVAALALTAAGQQWAELTTARRPPLPPVTAAATGSDLAPLAPAAALVLLAAAGALLAVRGAGRVLVGLLMAVAGAGMAWSAGRVLAGGDPVTDRLLAMGVPAGDLTRDVSPFWPALVVAAGVVGVGAGVVVVVRGGRWPAMGRRYERAPGSPPRPEPAGTDDQRAQAAWSALDRGEDPTVPPDGSRP